MYLFSVLTFVAQLEPPLAAWEAAEQAACRALFRGTTRLLGNVKHFGLPAELPDLHCAAQAVKCRVHNYQCRKTDGLKVAERARHLDRAVASCDILGRRARRRSRFQNSPLRNLHRAHDKLWRSPPHSKTLDGMAKHGIRARWQHICHDCLRPPSADDALRHVRRRLDRWQA
ncbi:unnamed protein product [Prorocentrum cordatum]|uniref:RNA-directed DNA polymerase n=1 Tax=Prorocentrum cordatum TaxID=2364126 RepID=A0ABN9TQ01_9DINO|nr:unnamed protein product [Polarella glacialis]